MHFKCDRKTHYNKDSNIKKQLDDFCENRDFLKKELNLQNNIHFFTLFSNYITERKLFLSNENKKCYNEQREGLPCHIDENYTINNVDLTFPSIECPTFNYLQHNAYIHFCSQKNILEFTFTFCNFPIILFSI